MAGRNRCRQTVRALDALGDDREPQLGLKLDDQLVLRMQALAGDDRKPGVYQNALKPVTKGGGSVLLGRTG